MAGYIRTEEQALAEADRRFRHAIRTSFPFIRAGITAVCGLTAVFTDGTMQGATAAVGVLSAVSAAKSVYEDRWFWGPAIADYRRLSKAAEERPADVPADVVEGGSISLERK